MVKIAVIGLGVVGGAVYKHFAQQTTEALGFDLYRKIGSFEVCLATEAVFLCLPTRYCVATKTYDTTEIERTLQKLSDAKYCGLVVVKSTVLPGTTEKLLKQWPSLKLVHHPEFLKARSAYEDYSTQKRLVYGVPRSLKAKRAVQREIRRLNRTLHPGARTLFAGSNESEMIKLMSNGYYATQIQYFNEVYALCQQVDTSYGEVKELLHQTGLNAVDCTRVPGPDGKFSYSGMCLPKDSSSLLGMMRREGVIHRQLQATVDERECMRRDDVNIDQPDRSQSQVNMYDATREFSRHKIEFLEAIEAVLESGQYIGGNAIQQLETELASYVGVEHCLGVSSGTDALLVALMALGVKPGDEVLTVSFSWVSTVTMIKLLGATPVYVDIDPIDFNLDTCLLANKCTSRTRGIIVVSLFGQMPDMAAINRFAERKGLWVVEDGAQSFGATQGEAKSCGVTTVGTTSFFPTKPLGCFGDGGAVFTNDGELAERMRAIRNHGAIQRPHHPYLGINGRLDTVQAAVLRVKLGYLDEQLERRRNNARYYQGELAGLAQDGHLLLPVTRNSNTHVWAQYTVTLRDKAGRDGLLAKLAEAGVNVGVFYPVPIHRQPFADASDVHLPVTDMLADRVLSLPVYPELDRVEQDRVITVIKQYLGRRQHAPLEPPA